MIPRQTPIQRSALKRSTKPIAKRRSKPRRTSVLRDRGYLDWLKDRECVIRDGGPSFKMSDPAHGPSTGMRVKGPDNEAIPLCRHHHNEQHRIGWQAFEAKYGFSREKEAAAHYALYRLVGMDG